MKIVYSALLLTILLNITGKCKGFQQSHSASLVVTIQDICWSPDGKTIYFSAMKHKPDYSDYKPEIWSIYKYKFSDKSTSKFLDSAYTVAVSSSGEKIAAGKIISGNRDIYIYDKNGNNPKRITSHPGNDQAASFSPDEKQIVFNSNRDGKTDIFITNIDTPLVRQFTVTTSGEGNYNPQWSPDGKQIVFYQSTANSKDQIFVMNSDRTNLTNITRDNFLNYYPTWAGNSNIIYTQDIKGGKGKIFSISSNGKNKKQFLGIQSFYAKISPDGEMVAYVDEKDQCINVISVQNKLINKIFLN